MLRQRQCKQSVLSTNTIVYDADLKRKVNHEVSLYNKSKTAIFYSLAVDSNFSPYQTLSQCEFFIFPSNILTELHFSVRDFTIKPFTDQINIKPQEQVNIIWQFSTEKYYTMHFTKQKATKHGYNVTRILHNKQHTSTIMILYFDSKNIVDDNPAFFHHLEPFPLLLEERGLSAFEPYWLRGRL